MKRSEILERLQFSVPNVKKKRVIIHSDVKNEADDHFAIMHHLLTPCVEIEGIIAAHFEYLPNNASLLCKETNIEYFIPKIGTTMELSFMEAIKLLDLAEIDDIPLFRGAKEAITDKLSIPKSDGADFIIKQAMSDDPRPLHLALMGNLTDLAIAYLKEPKIAEKIIAIWIGGGVYPKGEMEFNMIQDIEAARIVFNSPLKIWQIPNQTYVTMQISFAELIINVKSCGSIGNYLCEQMFDFNEKLAKMSDADKKNFPHGEIWSIGDNPTLSVLLQGDNYPCWHIEKAPYINNDLSYSSNVDGKDIRVYDKIDTRLTINDFFSKMKLCYK